MTDFTLYDLETAPDEAKPFLAAAKDKFGFIPNVLAIQAEAPALLKGYMTLSGIFGESGFSAQEQQVILLTASRANKCHYCTAAHSMGATAAGIDKGDIDAIRAGELPSDAKLAALSALTRQMVDKRGWLDDNALKPFLDAGYAKADVMHVVLGIAVKTMTHYVNHIADTPVDKQFEKFKL